MITMTNRNQDYSCNNDYIFYADSYNLQPGNAEQPDEFHSSEDPYVLTALRNVFSEEPHQDYELVYNMGRQPLMHIPPEQNHLNHLHNNLAQQNPNPHHQEVEEEEDHEEEDDEDMEDEERPRVEYPCTECNKTYTSERRLKHHLVVHKNKEAYKCPTCGYCYQSPDSLKRHMKKASECNPDLINDGGDATGPAPQS